MNIKKLAEQAKDSIPESYVICNVDAGQFLMDLRDGSFRQVSPDENIRTTENYNIISAPEIYSKSKYPRYHFNRKTPIYCIDTMVVDDYFAIIKWSIGYEELEYYVQTKMDETYVQSKVNGTAPIAYQKPKLDGIFAINKKKEKVFWNADGKNIEVELPYILQVSHCFNTKNLNKKFKEFFDFGWDGRGNTYYFFDDYKSPAEFLNSPTPHKTSSKQQQTIDAYAKFPLPVHDIYELESEEAINGRINSFFHCKYSIVDIINENLIVFRWYVMSDTLTEVNRLYVDNDVHYCVRMYDNEWISAPAKNIPRDENKVLMNDEIFEVNTKLKYFKDLCHEFNGLPTVILSAFVANPELEKIYKAGLFWLCKQFFVRGTKWTTFVKTHIGPINKTGKTIYAVLGLNKYQMTKVNEYVEKELSSRISRKAHDEIRNSEYNACHPCTIIQRLKTAMNMDAINDIDNATFDSIFAYLTSQVGKRYLVQNAATLSSLYPLNKVAQLLNNYSSISIHYFEDELFTDTIRMLAHKDYSKQFSIKYSCSDNVQTIHDNIMTVYNQDKDLDEIEKTREVFEKRRHIWEKWTFAGKEFSVIAPQNSIEIAQEGVALHHCVKSYIPDVVAGKTNILFIRRNDSLMTPFYTVEIDNRGHVKQVRGVCNCSPTQVPDLLRFLNDWSDNTHVALPQFYIR